MRSFGVLIAIALAGALPTGAQANAASGGTEANTEVRTFQLRHLRSKDAAQLVAPYATLGMVFEAGATVHAITVRDTPAKLARIDSIIRQYDLPPQSVTLRFQLVASTSESTSDSRIREVEPSLRQLFSFPGYRLVGEGTTVVGEIGDYTVTLAGNGRRYTVSGTVGQISRGEAPAVRLGVTMSGSSATVSDSSQAVSMMMTRVFGALISTDITLKLGSLAVLGSGTEGVGDGVLILMVRPELR